MSEKIITIATPHPETLREEWFIAPSSPGKVAPREWHKTEEGAVKFAMEHSEAYDTFYEVYKRTHFISVKKVR